MVDGRLDEDSVKVIRHTHSGREISAILVNESRRNSSRLKPPDGITVKVAHRKQKQLRQSQKETSRCVLSRGKGVYQCHENTV
jgi:hypothetical protein